MFLRTGSLILAHTVESGKWFLYSSQFAENWRSLLVILRPRLAAKGDIIIWEDRAK
jgi:hypothetical protein